MRLIFLLALKNLTSKTTRTASSILAISIGLGTAIAIFTLDHNTILSQRARLKMHYGEPDLELKPLNKYRVDIAGLEKKLQRIKGIETLSPIFFHSTNIYPKQSRPANIFLCGLTPQGNERFNAYRLVEGQDLPDGNMKVILLTTSLAQMHNIKLGEYVYFKKSTNQAAPQAAGVGKPAEQTISSKCLSSTGKSSASPQVQAAPHKGEDASMQWNKFKVVGFIAPEHLGGKNGSHVGIVPFYAGVESFNSIFPFFWAGVTGNPPDNLRTELEGLVSVSRPSFAIVGESSMERAFRNGVHICGFFALGLGLLVVFNSFSMSLMDRIKQIGLLRLVGATSGQISLILLAEAAIIAAIASILGLALGLGLTKILIKFRITTLGLGKQIYSFHVPWMQVMGIMALGIMMDCWGALYPMFKARRISPVRAIFPREGETVSQSPKISKLFILIISIIFLLVSYFLISPFLTAGKQARIFILSGLGGMAIFVVFLFLVPVFSKYTTRIVYLFLIPLFKVEGRLAKKNIENSPSRINFSISALMLVVAAVLSLKIMIRSMDKEIDVWAANAMHNRAFLYSGSKLSLSDLQPIRSLSIVQALIPMSAYVTTPYFIKGVDTAELAKYGPFARNPDSAIYKELSNTDSLIISSQFARRYNLTQGDRLNMLTAEGKIDFHILAVMDDYGFFPFQRSYALMEESKLARYFCITGDEIDQFNVKIKQGYNAWDLYREIWHKIKWPDKFFTPNGKFILEIATEHDITKVFHDNIRPNFVIFDVIIYMIVVLIGVGTLNSLLISALERKKEIGLMRVVGMTSGQISRTLFIEGGMIGLVSGILGVLMGLPLSLIAINGLKMLSGLQLSYPLPVSWIVICFTGAIIVAALAGIYPAAKTRKFSVIEAIKYE